MTEISQVVTPGGGGPKPPMAPLAALPVQSVSKRAAVVSNPMVSPVVARVLGSRVPADMTGTQAMARVSVVRVY